MTPTDRLLTTQYLALAQECLAHGETASGRELAQHAFTRSCTNEALQGQSLLVLAQLDVLDSQLVRALRLGRMASTAFRSLGDTTNEALALTTFSYAASALKHDELALAATERSISLVDHADEGLVQANGLNYLGLAQMWAGKSDQAIRTFEASVWYAEDTDRPETSFQPLVNSCVALVFRHHQAVYVQRESGAETLSGMHSLTQQAQRLWSQGAAVPLNRGTTGSGLQALLEFSMSYAFAQSGDFERSEMHALACRRASSTWAETTWLRALFWWARFELANQLGDLHQAQQLAWAMHSAAAAGQQRHLETIAARLTRYIEARIAASRVVTLK